MGRALLWQKIILQFNAHIETLDWTNSAHKMLPSGSVAGIARLVIERRFVPINRAAHLIEDQPVIPSAALNQIAPGTSSRTIRRFWAMIPCPSAAFLFLPN